jgi:hypothetical protein
VLPNECPLDKLQSILAPERFTVDQVPGDTENPDGTRVIGGFKGARRHVGRSFQQRVTVEATFVGQSDQQSWVGDVGLFGPDRAADAPEQPERESSAVVGLSGQNHVSRGRRGCRKVSRVQIKWLAQMLAPPFQFEQSIGLSCLRALRQRQKAVFAELAKIYRMESDFSILALEQRHETCIAKVNPGRDGGEVEVHRCAMDLAWIWMGHGWCPSQGVGFERSKGFDDDENANHKQTKDRHFVEPAIPDMTAGVLALFEVLQETPTEDLVSNQRHDDGEFDMHPAIARSAPDPVTDPEPDTQR